MINPAFISGTTPHVGTKRLKIGLFSHVLGRALAGLRTISEGNIGT